MLNATLNATNSSLFQGLVETVSPLFLKASLLVGGVFGIYLILLMIRIYYEHRKMKILKDIRFNLEQQNKKKKIPYSRQKKK